MNTGSTIQDELNDLNSGLNANSNTNPYSVPEGYFEGLADTILAKVKTEQAISAQEEIAQLSPLLAGISRQLPHSVPDNYFESNLEGLKAFTSENEESLVLSFIDKEMPYQVPTGYFAGISDQVLQKVSDNRSTVIPLMRRKWMRLAVAAMAAGIISISGITYFNNRSTDSTMSGDPIAVELKKVSTEELNEFITTTTVGVTDDNAEVTVKNNTPKTEVKKLFADVSDNELDAFLSQMPTDADEIDIN